MLILHIICQRSKNILIMLNIIYVKKKSDNCLIIIVRELNGNSVPIDRINCFFFYLILTYIRLNSKVKYTSTVYLFYFTFYVFSVCIVTSVTVSWVCSRHSSIAPVLNAVRHLKPPVRW